MLRNLAFLLVSFLLFISNAHAQRESWSFPNGNDWKKPALVEWQRNFADANAVARATGKALLVCVNMDGEAASENYAGIRYRDPEFAKLVNAFVPVIVSVNRHNARDYNEQGQRIPCPRFGRIICSEHIELEPPAYDKYFKQQRVAPRHIGVEGDAKILFDCFLNFDVSPVVKALKEHGGTAKPESVGQPAIETKVKSRNANDRILVEKAYIDGDAAKRKSLLEAAAHAKGSDPFELIRLGLNDTNDDLRALARKALTSTATAGAVSLLIEAVRQTREEKERDALVQLLIPLAKENSRARAITIVYRALKEKSSLVKTKDWEAAFKKNPEPPKANDDLDALERTMQESQTKLKISKDNAAAAVDFGKAALRFYEIRTSMGKDASFVLDEAAAIVDHIKPDAKHKSSIKLVRGRIEAYRNNIIAAGAAIQEALPDCIQNASSAESLHALWVFGSAMRAQITKASSEGNNWPGSWLTDADAAFDIAEKHPLSNAYVFAGHADLLITVEALDEADRVILAGLQKFADASPIHERYRSRVLADKGIGGLDAAYAELIKKNPESAPIAWFGGYAAIVSAEFHKRSGNDADAKNAYARTIEQFERSIKIDAAYEETANHHIAMANAGLARIHLESGDLDAAVAGIVAALQLKPEVYESEDGLGRTPKITLNAMRWVLDEKNREDLREKLEASLEKIDSEIASRPAKK
ncbi:MAG: hypothetical protein ACKVS6_09645 [Planctomycetota bacterium]